MSVQNSVLEIRDLRKDYGGPSPAVAGVSIAVARGEVVCLLGPSGCGKTTTLRAIAGFAKPTGGSILIDGEDITKTSPHQRNVGMVFQSYALFPHLNVAENIAFGLRSVGTPATDRQARVAELLQVVQLEEYGTRFPRELSGGQQQRVAFARALALRPSVLLLDEPFSNLDAQLRLRMREEVRSLIDRLGITTIFVTHDQEEALAIADRIVVMNRGVVEQEGSPHEIYESPRTRFVAEFIGRCNLLHGAVTDDGRHFRTGGDVLLPINGSHRKGPSVAAIRPEHLCVAATGDGASLRGQVVRAVYRGPSTYLYALVGGSEWLLEVPSVQARRLSPGAPVSLAVAPEHVQILHD